MKCFITPENDLTNRTIVHRVLRSEGVKTVSLFPNFESLYRTLRAHREYIINPQPYKFPELKLSDRLTKTFTGDKFY